MEYACRVYGLNPVKHGNKDFPEPCRHFILVGIETLFFHGIIQGPAGNVFQGHVFNFNISIVNLHGCRVKIIYLNHIGMTYLSHGMHFLAEASEGIFNLFLIILYIFKPLLGNDFNGNVPVKVQLVGTIDFTHASLVNELQDHPFIIQYRTCWQAVFCFICHYLCLKLTVPR